MSDAYLTPLVTYGRTIDCPESGDIYAPFIGEWDCDWVEGMGTYEERHVRGEWLFSWMDEGKAVQDIFICPSRKEREKTGFSEAEYGTTIRQYDAVSDKWFFTFMQRGVTYEFEVDHDPQGGLIQNMINHRHYNMIWRITDITADSFKWSNNISKDNGETWRTLAEMLVTRRTS